MENLSTRMLLTELSQDEKNARGEEVGNVIAEIESLQDQLKAASGGIKAKINDAKKKERRLGHILATGKEEREIEVKTVKDWEHKEVTIIRMDTGAEIERRTMTASEAQADLLDRGAEPGKLLSMDGGKMDGPDGGDAQQAELSPDEQVWVEGGTVTAQSEEQADVDEDDEVEHDLDAASGLGDDVPAEEAPAIEPAKGRRGSPKKKRA